MTKCDRVWFQFFPPVTQSYTFRISANSVNKLPWIHVFSHLYIDFACKGGTCKLHFFLKAAVVHQYFSRIPIAHTSLDSWLKPCCICNTLQALTWQLVRCDIWRFCTSNSALLSNQQQLLMVAARICLWKCNTVLFLPRGKRHRHLYLPLANTLHIPPLNYFLCASLMEK